MAPPFSDRPAHERLTLASLAGISARYATRGDAHWAAGIAELRQRAGDRADLLAEAAGLTWGSACRSGGRPYWYFHERQVLILLDAGADPDQVPHWFDIGLERSGRPRPSV